MSKRQDMLEPCGRTAAKRRRPQRQRHIYLVVDDWERGYSVRKLDVDDDALAFFDSGDRNADLDLDDEVEPLPEPPVVRFNASHCCLSLFAGHGTSILAMPVSSTADAAFPVFDTKTLELSFCAHPNGNKVGGKPFFASVAGDLYLLDYSCLSVLDAPRAPPPRTIRRDEQWSWETITTPTLPAPVSSNHVKSSALHPDGRTLFVSEWNSTFSLDTESLEWTCHGDWAMPFQGQAYFDDELDVWVGLCRHKGGVGYVCCCDVPKRGGGAMPDWKLCKDQLFYTDKNKARHVGATLVALGGISEYCLIKSLVHKAHHHRRRPDEPIRGQSRRRVLYVTRFGLKYDKEGQLRTTRRRARSYEMTEAHELGEPCSAPVAFWM